MTAKNNNKALYEGEHKSSAYKSKTDPPQYFLQVMLDGSEPPEATEFNGAEYERTDHIPIDLDAIPDRVRDELARATLEALREFLSQPGGREKLDAMAAARKAREML